MSARRARERTCTNGTGVLIAEVARLGASRILATSGGSATTDGSAIAAIEELGGLHGADMAVLRPTRFSVTTAMTRPPWTGPGRLEGLPA